MFGISKSCAYYEIHDTIRILEKELGGEVAWPTDQQLDALCWLHEYNVDSFGSVDATFYRIEKPTVNQREMYNGYKKMHAFKTQYITAPNGYVLHVSTGWPGSMADKYNQLSLFCCMQLQVYDIWSFESFWIVLFAVFA